ncbi:hypothetical protein Mapa_011934 [Marchantia paleacea]|nr:hypothetical protein Mapa_011934 [Marchantia paleacea]
MNSSHPFPLSRWLVCKPAERRERCQDDGLCESSPSSMWAAANNQPSPADESRLLATWHHLKAEDLKLLGLAQPADRLDGLDLH